MRPTPAQQLTARTGYVLIKLGEAALDAAEHAVAPLALRAKHVSILTLIEAHRLSQQELCTLTGLDRTTMVGLIDDLERHGFASRERDANDRRRYVVSLTRDGAAALQSAQSRLDGAEAELFGNLAPAERRMLHQLATRVLASTGSTPDIVAPPAG